MRSAWRSARPRGARVAVAGATPTTSVAAVTADDARSGEESGNDMVLRFVRWEGGTGTTADAGVHGERSRGHTTIRESCARWRYPSLFQSNETFSRAICCVHVKKRREIPFTSEAPARDMRSLLQRRGEPREVVEHRRAQRLPQPLVERQLAAFGAVAVFDGAHLAHERGAVHEK